jgi:hypothetical protein
VFAVPACATTSALPPFPPPPGPPVPSDSAEAPIPPPPPPPLVTGEPVIEDAKPGAPGEP